MYLMTDRLYLYAEFLIQVEMYKIDRTFPNLKRNKQAPLGQKFSKNSHFLQGLIFISYFNIIEIYQKSFTIFNIIICYMRPKRRNDKIFVYINGRNKDMENKTGILYNDTVDQLKGMQRSLVARLFWVQNVAGSNPVIPTYYLSSEQ